eukprot:13022816-Heterocapsa_arctica.AAC.1
MDYPTQELAITDLLHLCEGVSYPPRLLSSMLGKLIPKQKRPRRRGARTSQVGRASPDVATAKLQSSPSICYSPLRFRRRNCVGVRPSAGLCRRLKALLLATGGGPQPAQTDG